MDEQATGLILRTRPLTESSLIVHWLTAECGRIATVAKGALRPKSPLRGKLDLFFQARLSFQRSRRGDLHTLREVTLIDPRPSLRGDLERLRQASCAVVFIEKSTETDTPLPDLYPLVLDYFDHLARHSASPIPLLAFEARGLAALGFAPDADQSGLTPGARALLRHLLGATWEVLPQLKPSAPQARELQRFLTTSIRHHLDWNPGVLFDA